MHTEVEQIEALVAEACDLTERCAAAAVRDDALLEATGALRLELLAATSTLVAAGPLDDAYGAVLALDEAAAHVAALPRHRHVLASA